MRHLHFITPLLLSALAVACAETDAPPGEDMTEGADLPAWRAIATPYGWRPLLEASEDPFADARPEGWSCPEQGYGVEDFGGEAGYDIRTMSCDPLTVEQATFTDVRAGDPIELRVWNGALSAPEADASARVIFTLGGEVLIDEELLIPRAALLNTWEVAAPADAPAGTPLVWHVRNHGANTWTFLSARVFN